MENWLILMIVGIGGFIISLFFEDARDWYIDTWESIITGEIFGNLWDFISGAFENIGEFSFYGLGFGALAVVLIYYLRNWMIQPFVQYFSPAGQLFWTIATYVVVFVGGYFMGNAFENS
jgi:MFS superfamily sulfate permease-like transporter